jgi:hypothetical protein
LRLRLSSGGDESRRTLHSGPRGGHGVMDGKAWRRSRQGRTKESRRGRRDRARKEGSSGMLSDVERVGRGRHGNGRGRRGSAGGRREHLVVDIQV